MAKIVRLLRLSLLIVLQVCRRHWRALVAACILTSLTFFLQYKFGLIQNQNLLSEGLVGTYQEHDIPLEVTELLSEGLVGFDSSGRMVPKLVSGWDKNNDATEFTFKLKDHLNWSDGSAVKSSDLEFTIPNTEVSYPSEREIKFKLKDSYAPFPSLLTKPIFKKNSLIGIGPYKLINLYKSRVFLTKLILNPLNPSLPQVVVRFYPNEKTALTGFSLGEVQSLLGVNFTNQISHPLARWRQKTDYSKVVAIMYSTKDQLLANRSLRQALSYAAPEFDSDVLAKTPIVPYSFAFDSGAKDYLNNLEEAKSALERAKSSSNLEGRQIILTTTPQLEEEGKKIIASWKQLGLDAVLRVESGISQNFQALLIIQSIPVDPDQYFLWHSTQTKTNLTKYSQARVDKDLEDGRKITNEEERKSKYQDFQKVLLEDAPATFLYFPKYNALYLKKAEQNLNKVLPLQLP